jgi:hypothetical protein
MKFYELNLVFKRINNLLAFLMAKQVPIPTLHDKNHNNTEQIPVRLNVC